MENIKYRAKLPWFFNILPIIHIVIGFGGIIAFSFANGMIKFLGLCLMFLIFKGIFKLLLNLTTKIYLTDKNITIKRGIIRETTIDVLLDKSESIWISQSILGKLFNFGCLSITTAGMNISQVINNPIKFKAAINKTKINSESL